MQDLDRDIRHFIYTTFAHTSRPPTTRTAAKQFNLPVAEAENVFERLADAHHIALATGTHTIWMAHPFSGLPTNYSTEIGGKKYWGNWVWDVFGIAAILGENAVAHAPCGCGTCDKIFASPFYLGQQIESDWLVHFVVPAAKFWDKIGYTWATILPFSSEEHLERWLTRRDLKKGYTMPIQTCWELAQRWYTGRLERGWQRPDAKKTRRLFDSLNLKGDFWNLS